MQEYLSLKSKSTKSVYSTSFRLFLDYYETKYGKGKGFTHFLDRVFDELKKDRRDQKRVAELEIVEYLNWLKDKNASSNTIRLYFVSIQNFLKYKGILVSSSFIGNLPPATGKKENGKHQWKLEHLREFVEKLPTLRDKAIALCMFQSGLAVNEICELSYGDIADEYEKGIIPICVSLTRKKTGIPFKTFFGRDAVHYLRAYLQTRNLKADSPLFCIWGTEQRISTTAIQQRFGETAPKLSFLSKHSIENGYCPIRPHSLRSGFKSRLTSKVDRDIIEFFMGHKLAGVGDNYLNLPLEDLREIYQDAEKYLAVEKTSRDEQQALEFNISEKAQRRISELEQSVHGLQHQLGEQEGIISKIQNEYMKKLGEIDALLLHQIRDEQAKELEQKK